MTDRRARGQKSLSRKTAVRSEKRTYLIFAEGEVSEVEYLNALKNEPTVREANAVELEISPDRGVPLTLVRLAVAAKNNKNEIDQFWCVFDVEWPQHHPNLREAIDLARANDIQLAISNPCFEIWLILHHREQGAFLDNTQARQARKTLDGSADKHIDTSIYLSSRHVASSRAEKLDARHMREATRFPEDNPSSSMWRLVNSIDPRVD